MEGLRPEETVLAMDNVPLELPLAGAGSRSLAAFLDYLIVAVLSAAWAAGCFSLYVASGARGYWPLVLAVIGLFLTDYGYFAGVEVATGGRTFGKWAVGLSVVNDGGGRAGTPALLLRNAVRSVDLVVGIPLMAIDPRARRLGDRLAGTLVVHVDESRANEAGIHRIPRGWGGREVGIAEDFLRRVGDLEPPRARRMARALLSLAERTDPELLSRVPTHLDPVERLRQLLQPAAGATRSESS